MLEITESSLKIPAALLLGALASSAVYAAALSTRVGKKFADQQTWSTVVAGVILTLAWFAAYSLEGALWAAVFFVVTGIPQVVRSLWLQLEMWDRAMDRSMQRRMDDNER